MDHELWTITQCSEHLGTQPPTTRRTLGRLGIRRTSWTDDPHPRALYDAATVQAAHAARPGQGHRTDLQRK